MGRFPNRYRLEQLPHLWPSTIKMIYEFFTNNELSDVDIRELKRGAFPVLGCEMALHKKYVDDLPTLAEGRRAISYRGENAD